MNRYIFRITCIIFMVVVLSQAAFSAGTSPQGEVPKVLSVFCQAGSLADSLGAAINMWNEKHATQITLITVAASQAHPKQTMELIAGIGPEIRSVGVVQNLLVRDYLEGLNQFILEEDDKSFLESYFPSLMKVSQEPFPAEEFDPKGGKIIGIPWRGGVYVLAYRTDLLEEAGLEPPRTLSEFFDAAVKLTTNGVYGIGMPGLSSGGTAHTAEFFEMILENMGGSLLTADKKKSALDEPVAREALEFCVKISKYAPPEFVTWSQAEQVAAGQAGLVAMQLVYHHRLFTMDDPKTSPTAGKWDATSVPGKGLGMWSGHLLAIRKGLEPATRDVAWEFIKFATSPEVQKVLMLNYANSSPISVIYDDPDVVKKFPYAAGIKEALGKGYFPLYPEETKIEDILAEELNALYAGMKSLDAALLSMHERLNAVLD